MGVWAKAEVLDGLAGVLWATEKDDVGTSWCTEGELVESKGLTTGLLDASAGGRGEAESADAQLWDLEETVVIGDGTDYGADLALVCLLAVLVGRDSDDLGEGDRWSVDARHAQSVCESGSDSNLSISCSSLYAPPQDGSIELAVCTAVEEAVQLVQQLAVWVGAVWRLNT